MDDSRNVLEALEALDPSRLSYDEWIETGMALKAEGHPCSVWDEWSSRDRDRYIPGDCEKRWQSFNSTGVGGGTIVHLAQTYSNYTPVRALSWNDGLDAYYEEVLTVEAKPREQPYQMAVRYLETLFQPEEKVSFVNQSIYKDKQGKWVPMNAGHVRKCSDLIADLKKYKELNSVFGTINPEAGAWIRFNPTTGPNDKDVTRFAYSLVESDDLSIEEQKKLLINLKLPIACLVESGGKSVHAIVKIDATDESEYKQRVSYLYDQLAKRGFLVDGANKNPARLSRLPGALRGDKVQKLVATNIGCKDWKDWMDYLAGIDDNLPQIVTFAEQRQNPPEEAPELIGGILREGNKMIITGDSKSGKTCLSQELAVCIAEGKPWLGEFKCEQGAVLYLNFECQESSLYKRFECIYKENGWKYTKQGMKNISVWNLRGHAIPLEKMVPLIVRRVRRTGPFLAIFLDPLYKVQQGDENSAEAITKFCNALDQLAQETGAAVIYDHHHPKGYMGERKAIDRGAGSGVFARDADAIIDLSMLDPSPDLRARLADKLAEERPMLMSFALRDFKDVEDTYIWFKFPVHYIDKENLLKGVPLEGSRDANLQKSPNFSMESTQKDVLDNAFMVCEKNGKARISDMAKQINKSGNTVKRYVDKFPEEYQRNDSGEVWRLE
jgi:hypothetical protein